MVELRGVATGTLREALAQMEAIAAGTRCRKGLYHANLDPDPKEAALTGDQQRQAIDLLEARLGLGGHPRAVVRHVKNGRAHLHAVWSRIDQRSMKAVHDGHNYRAHEEVARALERLFGHARVQGAHHEREGVPRPVRPLPGEERQQAGRTGIDPKTVASELTRLWQTADSGRSFRAALAGAGYVLARGDRRDFCVVDRQGGVHSLARRVEGARAADIRVKLADLRPDVLPDVAAARAALLRGDATAKSLALTAALSVPSTGATPTAKQPRRQCHSTASSHLALPAWPAAHQLPGRLHRYGRPIANPGRLTVASLVAGSVDTAAAPPRLRPVTPVAKSSSDTRSPAGAPRPAERLFPAAGLVVPEELIGWAHKRRWELIAYSNETGADIIEELAHLMRIVTGAYLELGLTATGKKRVPKGLWL